MSIKYKVYQSEFPYHIYNRTNNREFLFNLERDYKIFTGVLKWVAKERDVKLHHFVLMKNHYHLVASTPQANLGDFMRSVQTMVSQKLNEEKKRINHIFGGRYGATVIQSTYYMTKIIQYVYLNPAVANITKNPFDYPYSTIKLFQNDTHLQHGYTLDPYLNSLCAEQRKEFLESICYNYPDAEAAERIRKKLKSPII